MKITFRGNLLLHIDERSGRDKQQAATSSNAFEENATQGNSGVVHKRSALQASLFEQASFLKKCRAKGRIPRQEYKVAEQNKECLKEWNAWAQEADIAPNENRKEAYERMKAWLNADRPNDPLDLSMLGLTSLPNKWPDSLQRLRVEYNELTYLPEKFPTSLQELDASNNKLRRLPEKLPTSLQKLSVTDNQLRSLPENLPDSIWDLKLQYNKLRSLPKKLPKFLKILNVSNNKLRSLPETLPKLLQMLYASENKLINLPKNLQTLPLQRLHVSNNRLTSLQENLPESLEILQAYCNHLISLSEDITARLSKKCRINIEYNPFPEEVLNSLFATINAPGYNGPQLDF